MTTVSPTSPSGGSDSPAGAAAALATGSTLSGASLPLVPPRRHG